MSPDESLVQQPQEGTPPSAPSGPISPTDLPAPSSLPPSPAPDNDDASLGAYSPLSSFEPIPLARSPVPLPTSRGLRKRTWSAPLPSTRPDAGRSSAAGGRRLARRTLSARGLINLGFLGSTDAVLHGYTGNADGEGASTGAAGGVADDDEEEREPLAKELFVYFRDRPWKKKVLMLTVIGSVVWVAVDFGTTQHIKSFLGRFVVWMQNHPAGGFFVFVFLFIITTLAFIPPSILTLGSGVAFAKAYGVGPGIALAVTTCFFGSSVGAVIAFLRARYLMRDLIVLFADRYPVFGAVDKAIIRKGFRIYILLRLCPVIPYNAINYIAGITSVTLKDYTFALIGLLPWQIVQVVIGATVGSVDGLSGESQDVYHTVAISMGCTFSVIALTIITYFARQILKKEIKANQEPEADEQGSDDVESAGSNEGGSRAYRTENWETASARSPGECNDEEWFWIWT